MTELRENVLDDINAERLAQDNKWGIQYHNLGWWLTILGEEYGESCEAALKYNFGYDPDKADARLAHLRSELIQVAAVAVAICEAIDEKRLLGQ